MLINAPCMTLLLDAYVRPSVDVFPNLPWLSAMVLMSLCNCMFTYMYICIYRHLYLGFGISKVAEARCTCRGASRGDECDEGRGSPL